MPQPFGGRYRQIMVYVDPLKLEANELSLMDVYKAVNESNLILPAGDVRIGPKDYNIYANSQVVNARRCQQHSVEDGGKSSVLVGRCRARGGLRAIQTNIVRVDGQQSVYVPVFKQGGGSNTITIVNGMKEAAKASGGCAAAVEDHGGVRSVRLCQDWR